MAGTSRSRPTTQLATAINRVRRDEGFSVILVVSPVSDLDAGRPVSGRIMPFEVGDRVVYPHHGAAIVDRRETRKAFGQEIEYLVLKVAHGDLTVSVPADKADDVGVRPPISKDEVEDIMNVLRKRDARMPSNWSRRFKNHVEKLKSGDIYQVAEVVRNLSLRDKDKGLSNGEKSMLINARRVLVSELSFSLDEPEDDVEAHIKAILAA